MRSFTPLLLFTSLAGGLASLGCGSGSSGGATEVPTPIAPIASFTCSPASPSAGQTVSFTDTSAHSPTAWAWNFGDGATSTVQNPTHAFSIAGTYSITLTASNRIGQSHATRSVTVSDPGTTFQGSIILGAPTSTSIRAKVFSTDQSGSVAIHYGTSVDALKQTSAAMPLAAGIPSEVSLTGLTANTGYVYRLAFTATGSSAASLGATGTFHTARPAGSTFSFTIQADSHLDENSDLNVYLTSLDNVRNEAPDFHIDLGDTFMCEKHSAPLSAVVQPAADEATVEARYRYERANFGHITHSVPLFLVNGNHEGEAGWLPRASADTLPIWTTQARQRHFVNPVPDGFYGGDAVQEAFVGQRASYYAWQWGDALFIVLDPFWFSTVSVSKDPWGMTLGDRQYQWLSSTLASSTATFKFVFIHNLVGGLDGQMRGGIEAAPYFEWGGKNLDGTPAFGEQRPNWGLPIHDLLVAHHVTAVFHGHDHLYAKQELDGIVYQEVPQPSALNFQSGPSLASDYHYTSGTILSSSGHLRVTVAPDHVTSQYIRTWLPVQENAQRANGSVDDAWSVQAESSSPAFTGNVVLGCPTATSIKANVYSPDQSGEVILAYGTVSGSPDHQSASGSLKADQGLELSLEGLLPDTTYYYHLLFQAQGASGYSPGLESSFHTARTAGSTFTFCIQGDSHPERLKTQFDPDLYARTLLTAAADEPDFYLTLGDDFSVDTLDSTTVTQAQVRERYTIQRPYLGLIGRSSPVFLVNGNHEQAARYLLDDTADNVAVWAQNARNTLYSQPASDGFYSGNPEVVAFIGLLRNFYAWTWGDALFVTLDPYWGSPVCVDEPFGGGTKRSNLWDITHGDLQYQWLKATLEQSKAKYKFVFAHHVMGTGRGGIELATKYEWGGYNANGTTWGFTQNRPTWASPIQRLMADNHVTIFFQGHDHIWVRQQLDGVTYQTLSEPADPNYTLWNADAYLSGDAYPDTGYTRVTVSPDGVKVDYVRTWLPADESPTQISGATVFSYTLP